MVATSFFTCLMALLVLGACLFSYFPWWLPSKGVTSEAVTAARQRICAWCANDSL